MQTESQAGKLGPDWTDRYLAMLGLEREQPSLEALGHITSRHRRIPFENVSSLLRARRHLRQEVPPIDPEEQLSAWQSRRSGGICFEVADTLARLLAGLGYDAKAILCQISFPGSHQAILVQLAGRRFLVDAGNGAPFFEPIPLGVEFEIHRAGLGYRFHAGESAEEWVQDRLIDGAWIPFCRYLLREPSQQEKRRAYQRHHTPGQSWVSGSLRMIRCEEDSVWVLNNGEFTLHTATGKRSEQISDPAEYERLARDIFRLPALPMREGLAAYEELMRAAELSQPRGM
jgi:N-hydroxyarylamine O-acetyltransferase